MERWPASKKRRIKKYIESLGLPKEGKVLDFGCGRGGFTSVIKSALPLWDVYGCDISKVGLEMAREQIYNCTFLTIEEVKQEKYEFDLLFSNHVIEHVLELPPVFEDFGKLVKNGGHMVHILPARCDNSFEHWIAKTAIDGIDKSLGNRYYYEHPGHLRRLSVEEFCAEGSVYGFKLDRKYFSNKIFGTINWVTSSDTIFVKNMFSVKRVRTWFHKFLFLILQLVFSLVALLRTPAIKLPKAFLNRRKSKRKFTLFLFYLGFYPISFVVDTITYSFSEVEWRLYKRSGSEMYLFFTKN